jgi:solute carrier family 25 thiamine pyrophosphate transporter 19
MYDNEQVEGLRRHPRYGANVEPRLYKNVWHATVSILKMEGLAGLYKGLYPSLIKAAPASAITFVVYEIVSKELASFVT